MKFKVGDKVEIIMKGNDEFNVGDIGIITELKDDDGDYVVYALDGSDNWDYVKEYNLKLVEEPIRKQLGWKVIKGFPGMSKYNLISVKSRYDFATNSGVEEQLQPHLYPDIFEPVYEVVKKYYEDIAIGTPVRTIRVFRNGNITFPTGTDIATIDGVRKFRSAMIDEISYDGLEFTFKFKSAWYGCESDGTLITEQDLDLILKTYNGLKAQ